MPGKSDYDKLKQRLKELENESTAHRLAGQRIGYLNRLRERLLSSVSLGDKLKKITDDIVDIFKADFSRVWLIKEGDLCDSGCIHAEITDGPHICRYRDLCLHLEVSSGRYTHIDGEVHRRVPYGCYKIGRIASAEDRKFITNDVANDLAIHNHEWARELGLVSFAGYRILSAEGNPIGVLALFSQHIISAEEDSLLEDLANTTAQVIQTSQANEALRDSETKYRELANSLPQIVFETNEKGDLLFVNSNAFTVFGYTQSDLNKGLNALQMVIPEDCERAMENIQRVLEGEITGGTEYTAITKSGATFPIMILVNRVFRNNTPIGLRGIIIDLTQRKKAEKALRESEERYRNLFENAQVGLGRTRISDGKVLESNEKLAQIFGFESRAEFKHKFVFSEHYVDPGTREKMLSEIEKTGIVNSITARFYRKDGSIIWVRFDTRIVPEKGYMEDVVVDITKQREAETEKENLETQLQQAQKMEAIGTLAGGIAHDFNNLLMGMQGRTSLMLLNKDSSYPDYEHHKGIEEDIKSAANLTKQLLSFARGGKYEVKPSDLNQILNKSADMFGRTKKEIIIHQKRQKDIWTVDVDRGQIEQVLMNLYINAWQAMSGAGEIYLETENITLDDAFVIPYRVDTGRYVKLSVVDTGSGMDETTQQKIFDPFFTTKEVSRGTGLGLASAYGIIRNHGGIIKVRSKVGEGATFTIYLPASEKMVPEEKALSEEVKKGKETVLLIDDEDAIVDVGRKLLEALGYKVFVANGGKEAIEIYKKNQGEIDLVVLDMIMPQMGGAETYDHLKEVCPDIKVLLSSGYSIDGLAKTILAKGCDGFIQKPFGIKDLSQKLREILD